MVAEKDERQLKFLAAYVANGAHRAKAAEEAGIPMGTVRRWFSEDEDFRNKFDKAFREFETDLLETAFERAQRSDTMIIFLLKAIRPQRYDDGVRKQVVANEITAGEGKAETVGDLIEILRKNPFLPTEEVMAEARRNKERVAN